MDINKFTELIAEILFQQHGLHAKVVTCVKMNDVVLTGLCNDTSEEEELSPVVYTNSLYEAYLHTELSLNKAAEKVFELLIQPVPDIRESIQNYDYVLPRLRMAAASANNTQYLSDAITITLFGLYFYPIISLGDGMTCKVTKKMLHLWDVTNEQLIKDVSALMKEKLSVTTITFSDEADLKLHIVTDSERMYGASALLYPARLSELARSIGFTEVYVVPSSRYELLLMDTNKVTVKELRGVVHDVNEGVVSKEDFLSNDVFLLDTCTHKLSLCH